MQGHDPQNLNFYWATTFVRSLFEQGVRHVVISPGSRSTPLTLAFAVHPGFEKHVIIDERSAAFTALGIAKGSGIPTCLVCTSGTAVANYFPAIIEASNSGIPLIVASADRPPHQRGIGASQTIDQLKIFGDYPVFFHEIGEPKESDNSILRLQKVAEQAVITSKSKCGVSHLNFPFSKPFEPTSDYLDKIKIENEKHSKQSSRNYGINSVTTEIDEKIWSVIVSSERPIILVGPTNKSQELDPISELAKNLNAPILVEPGSNIPSSKYTISGFDGFLRNIEIQELLKPDLILRFGEEPVSKALNNFLINNKECSQIRFHSKVNFGDESLTATKTILLDGTLYIPELSGSADKTWLKDWRKSQKDYQFFREEQLYPSTPLTDGYVFNEVSKLMPKKYFVMLSNSFPVRDLSLFGDYDGNEIYVNRGAAGIDGIISTFFGLSKSVKKSGILFIGDIAFLHDTNALLNAQSIVDTLFIVILNNGGGTIFRMLPINEYKNKFTQYFETPQNVSIAALSRAYKIDHTLISRPEQLISNFEERLDKPGVHILECITNPDDSMNQRNLFWDYPTPKN
ncbi:MAG: 2-succinyl-5-enolpyruvyl-6-hydroxy-3-cyclohexene-1-carboxylic-acid synthase [Balneolaceae bacterium]